MNQRSATVFIVDDDDAVRSPLRLLLKSVGLSAEVAYPSARDFRRVEPGTAELPGPRRAHARHERP
ncbi:MAG: hypothetical protein R3E65_02505 [Steroidobacteraceae bacterium]